MTEQQIINELNSIISYCDVTKEKATGLRRKMEGVSTPSSFLSEMWVQIKGYEGLYEISNYGNVKSMRRFAGTRWYQEKIMVGSYSKDGYRILNLSKNNIVKPFKIHRLVAFHFLTNPSNFSSVNHIDGNKTNNKVSNLEWCTHKQNMIHAKSTGLCYSKKVKDVRSGKVYSSIVEAAKAFGLKMGTLSNYLNGTRPNKTTLVYE